MKTSLLTLQSSVLLVMGTLSLMAAAASNGGYSNEYMVCLVNKARAQNGASPLGINQDLTSAAQQHSDDMARTNNMDHTGSDGSSPGDRCQKAGFNWSAVAENIAFGQDSMDSVMDSWLNSPGHRENIMNPEYTMMGSAVSYSGSTPYYTQDFGCDGQQPSNIPTCDGNYPDMSSGGGGGGSSSGGSGGGGSHGGSMNSGGGGGGGSSYGGDDNSGGDQPQEMSYGGGQSQPQSQHHGKGGKHGKRGGGHSQGGHSGGSQTMQPMMQEYDGDSNGSGGGGFNGMGSSGGAHHGGFSSSNADWFNQQGFGQSPYGSGHGGHGGHGGANAGGFGGMGGMGGGMFGGGGHMGGFNGGGY